MSEFEFRAQATKFLTDLFMDLAVNEIEVMNHWDIDHLCYRVDNESLYIERKNQVGEFSDLVTETEVNGRLIATFKLREPILFQGWQIDLIEIPAPKVGKFTPAGFEHIEVVTDLPFSELEKRYRHLNIDLSGVGKSFNSELEIVLGPRNIKFHHQSLASVIRLESNWRVWQSLGDAKLLKDFHAHQPLIAGPLSLGLDPGAAEINILLKAKDLNEMKAQFDEQWIRSQGYRSKLYTDQGRDTLSVNFALQDLKIEVYAQLVGSVRQPAYLHFLAEERLLKIGGEKFRQKVLQARKPPNQKIEVAFARALGLAGDPLVAMSRLQTMSTPDLRQLIETSE